MQTTIASIGIPSLLCQRSSSVADGGLGHGRCERTVSARDLEDVSLQRCTAPFFPAPATPGGIFACAAPGPVSGTAAFRRYPWRDLLTALLAHDHGEVRGLTGRESIYRLRLQFYTEVCIYLSRRSLDK